MDQVQVLGWGEPTLKDPLFKLDTWHNTSAPDSQNMASADPSRVGGGGAFGGFIYSYNGTKYINAQGRVYPVISTFLNFKRIQQIILPNYTVNYDGKTKVMTVNYAGQTWSYNLANQKIGQQSDYLVDDKVRNTNVLWNDTKNMTLLSNAGNPSELAFALFASTGSGVNLQQFRFESFDYTTGGSYITIKYVDDITGVELKPSKTISGLGGNIQDLTSYLDIPGYKVQRNNANTYNLYRGGNKIEFKKGKVTVTYTYSPTVEKKVDRIYTYVGENASDLTVAQNFVKTQTGVTLPSDTKYEFVSGFDTTDQGDKQATVKSPMPNGYVQTVDIPYNCLSIS